MKTDCENHADMNAANANHRPHLLAELHGKQVECALRIERAVRRLSDIEQDHNERIYRGPFAVLNQPGDSMDDLRDVESEALALPTLIEMEHKTGACFETVRTLYVLAAKVANPVVLARHIRECLIAADRTLLTRADVREASVILAKALRAYCTEGPSDAHDRTARQALYAFNDLTHSLPLKH